MKPHLPVLGPKLGKELGAVRAALAAGEFEQLDGGGFRVLGHDLAADEVLVERSGKEGWAVASDEGVTVALDTVLDAELELEGRVYDLIHTLNTMRKEQGLELTDRINVRLPQADADLVERHADWIKAEVLAVSLETDGVAVAADRQGLTADGRSRTGAPSGLHDDPLHLGKRSGGARVVQAMSSLRGRRARVHASFRAFTPARLGAPRKTWAIKGGRMKHARRIVGLAVLLVASMGVSVGTAATGAKSIAWTESKAERVVVRDVRLQLDRATRVSMEEELRREISRFIGLQTLALEAEDDSAWWLYFDWKSRYQDALRVVHSGLRLEGASCMGARRIEGSRFRQFDCLVTSETLRIPSTDLQVVDGEALPAVVERESRELEPLSSQLRVRVTGSSTFEYR